MPNQIARPSVASIFITSSDGKNDLASGTAFLVQRAATTYLLTNWHNITGRNPQTNALLDRHGRRPEMLHVFHNEAGKLGAWVEKVEPLYNHDGSRRWLEHPNFPGGAVDAVALPLTDLDGTDFIGYELWQEGSQRPRFGASDGVNIVGFPFGLTGGGFLAIWVRGAIASEPTIDFNDKPCFLVDARTRQGQSGSPVILYLSSGYSDEEGNTIIRTGPPVERLLGIYSGRISAEADIGFVWKVQALREIIDAA